MDQVLIALQFYASDGSLKVVGDKTGVYKSTISLALQAIYNGDHIGNNYRAHSREIALWDTNCRLFKCFFTPRTNQWLTNLPSNRALNNVLKSSD